MGTLKILKILTIILLHFLIIFKIKDGIFSITHINTFNLYFLLLCLFYFFSSAFYFYKRDKGKGFFSFSILLFLMVFYLEIGFYKKIIISQGEGEEGYTLIEEEKGVLAERNILPPFIEKIERGNAKINFERDTFQLREKQRVNKWNFSLKLLKIFEGLEISLSFNKGKEIERVLYKPETPPFYFSPTTLPYRIYILKEGENYKIKIYRNKFFIGEKILKEEEVFSFEGLDFKYKKNLSGAIYEIKKRFPLYLFFIPLAILLFSFFDKYKK